MRWLTPLHGAASAPAASGCDAMQAVFATSYDIDAAKGTKSMRTFKNWLKMAREGSVRRRAA